MARSFEEAAFVLAGGLRVALLADEPAGVICTSAPGWLELSATLRWPPDLSAASVLSGLPARESVRADLEETLTANCCNVTGSLVSSREEELDAALDDLLRSLASFAAVHEAAMESSVLRARRPLLPGPAAVEALARMLWESGQRVGFGAARSPAPEGADVAVGCRGAGERLAGVLAESAGAGAVAR